MLHLQRQGKKGNKLNFIFSMFTLSWGEEKQRSSGKQYLLLLSFFFLLFIFAWELQINGVLGFLFCKPKAGFIGLKGHYSRNVVRVSLLLLLLGVCCLCFWILFICISFPFMLDSFFFLLQELLRVIFLWINCFYYSSTCDWASTFWTSVIDW